MVKGNSDPPTLGDDLLHNSANHLAESSIVSNASTLGSGSFYTAIDDTSSPGESSHGLGNPWVAGRRRNEHMQPTVESASSSEEALEQSIPKNVRFANVPTVHEYEEQDASDGSSSEPHYGFMGEPFGKVADHANDEYLDLRGLDVGLNDHAYEGYARGTKQPTLDDMEREAQTSSSVFEPSRTPYVDILEELIDRGHWYPEEPLPTNHTLVRKATQHSLPVPSATRTPLVRVYKAQCQSTRKTISNWVWDFSSCIGSGVTFLIAILILHTFDGKS